MSRRPIRVRIVTSALGDSRIALARAVFFFRLRVATVFVRRVGIRELCDHYRPEARGKRPERANHTVEARPLLVTQSLWPLASGFWLLAYPVRVSRIQALYAS